MPAWAVGGLSATARTWGTSGTPQAHGGAATLELRLFDRLEVRLGGVLLTQWPRRKAKVVLAALALHPRGLTAVQLAEILGERPGQLDGVQACASAVRRMLEPGLSQGARSSFVRFEDGRYQLMPARIAHVDVRAFQDAIARGEGARAGAPVVSPPGDAARRGRRA